MSRAHPHYIVLILLAAVALAACGVLDPGSTSGDAEPDAQATTPVTDRATGPLAAFIDSIPDARVPELDLQAALSLVAMPLSCVDRPHAAPRDRSTYLDEIVAARRPGYERNRAFYGCWDWHSAVNSTWAMVRINKQFPELPVAGLIREKLNAHLSRLALEGELEFFADNRSFERPYGWAWLLALYAELRSWDAPEATLWADNVQPLAEMFSQRTILWLATLQRPSRSGAHTNTAFALALMLDTARRLDDALLEEGIVVAARRLFGDDTDCPTAYEPWGADFLSPCLEEAALMATVLEDDEFLAWFDRFMPAVDSPQFLPLTTPVDPTDRSAGDEAPAGAGVAVATDMPAEPPAPTAASDDSVGPGETELDAGDPEEEAAEALRGLGSRSHLIGLAFIRADAMNRIAVALPPADPRVAAYRKIAAHHATAGFEAMFDADYAGSHWIGTFALKYLLSER